MRPAEDPLDRECRVFTSYLLGCAPGVYVIGKYADAHRVSPAFSNERRADLFFVRIARRHPALARLVDSHARIFAPSSLVRSKLILLLAILETSAPSCHMIDAVDGANKPALLLRLFGRGVMSVLSLLLATILFVPMQLVLGMGSGQKQ